MQTAYLLPLTVLFLLLALAALGFRARRRRGNGPLGVGGAAAVGLVLGKFVLDSHLVVYGAIAALVGASLWNSWPRSAPPAPAGALYQIGSIEEEEK
jgi:hypothetical protein